MQRYSFYQFDVNNFVVIDEAEQQEICVCSNYNEYSDAENRAQIITTLLNQTDNNSVN